MATTTPTLANSGSIYQVKLGDAATALYAVKCQIGTSPAVDTTRATDGSALRTWAAAYTRLGDLYTAQAAVNDTTQ